ncbi:MAG: acetylxylan esterase [Pyrinomonadaceae bacterium]|nr:acetylxylan esterase [Pyrinomonadaceae bacterium]
MLQAQVTSAQDRRLVEVCDLNKVYRFKPYQTKQEWLARAEHLRRQILTSAGLLPMPPKPPLNARIFDRIERSDYTIEKVYFESHRGFFVTGNLYRPRGQGNPRPAILTPHGHWAYGRLENTDMCSGPARAINFARQGYVVFTYDMIGYNDSTQLAHSFGGQREELWGINLAGLQLWNSIRAVDFLSSLPDVDRERIACTGESGGGTQTFLLMAVDDRIKFGAPVNMVSAHMQGGCLCENMPGLRIDTFNVELAALAAPRPLLLVSATGDWTRDTLAVEYPAIKSVYRLLDAEDKVHAVQMNAEHNYNKESREAVYAWFGRWLLGTSDEGGLKEKSFKAEMPPQLLVFYGLEQPKSSVNAGSLTSHLIESAEKQLDALKPKDKAGLDEFRKQMEPVLAQTLGASLPALNDMEVWKGEQARARYFTVERFLIGRIGKGDRVPATVWMPSRRNRTKTATLIVHEDGRAPLTNLEGVSPGPVVAELLRKGHVVMAIDCFQTGEAKGARAKEVQFFTTYNRTDDANRVQDILTAIAHLRNRPDVAQINLIGTGRAGLWCLLARGLAPQISRTVVDVAQFDNTSDEAFLKELFTPGLRRAGELRTAAALAAPSPLLIHHTGDRFRTDWISEVYQTLGASSELEVHKDKLTDVQVANWLFQ